MPGLRTGFGRRFAAHLALAGSQPGRSWFGAWYAEDVIRLHPQLTLSIGFRDEFTTVWNEVNGRAANYTFPNGVISTTPRIALSVFTVNHGKFLPQPRIGVAWSPFRNSKQTVIRAGSGMYNDLQDALGYRTDQNAPFNPTYSLPNLPVSHLPISPDAAVPATAKLVPGGVQPDLRTPALISWSFRIEQELTANTVVTAGYVGSHGYHEILGIDANEPFPVICPAAPCPANYPKNFPTGLAGAPVPSGAYYVPTAVKANPAIANTWTYFSEADSSYNALQVDVNHRFSGGFALRGVYTWSKTIDDGDSLNATTSGEGTCTRFQPIQSRRRSRPGELRSPERGRNQRNLRAALRARQAFFAKRRRLGRCFDKRLDCQFDCHPAGRLSLHAPTQL